MSLALNKGNLAAIGAKVRVPTYDRENLRPNVAHFGVGAFHRSHQAVYLDDLLCLPDIERWSECGIGLRPSDARISSLLNAQDGLYTLVERSPQQESVRVIGSIVYYLRAHQEIDKTLELLASPELRLVTLTVTESGYYTDSGTGLFDANNAAIRIDLARPKSPSTVVGILAEALNRRRLSNRRPFSVLSCDNVEHNGDVLKRAIMGYSAHRDPELASWIERNVSFPNCMVDRITPATTHKDIAAVQQEYGIEAGWPVITEPFRQWVIQDSFCNGRPPWELLGDESGILLVSDVAPYEQIKMRLLNGGHSALAYLGLLMQYEKIDEVITDPLMRRFLDRYFDQVSLILPNVPGVDLPRYKRQLIERFGNRYIDDSLLRVAGDGSAKLTKWTIPCIWELMKMDAAFDAPALVVAAWYECLLGSDEQDQEIPIDDSRKEWLKNIVARSDGLNTLLQEPSLFPEELRTSTRFLKSVAERVRDLQSSGARATLEKLMN